MGCEAPRNTQFVPCFPVVSTTYEIPKKKQLIDLETA
jgi:hypothetical protein